MREEDYYNEKREINDQIIKTKNTLILRKKESKYDTGYQYIEVVKQIHEIINKKSIMTFVNEKKTGGEKKKQTSNTLFVCVLGLFVVGLGIVLAKKLKS